MERHALDNVDPAEQADKTRYVSETVNSDKSLLSVGSCADKHPEGVQVRTDATTGRPGFMQRGSMDHKAVSEDTFIHEFFNAQGRQHGLKLGLPVNDVPRDYNIATNGTTQVNLTLFTAVGGEKFGRIVNDWCEANANHTAHFQIQFVPTPASPGAIPLPTVNTVLSDTSPALWNRSFVAGATPVYAQGHDDVHITPITMAAGDTIVLSACASAAGTSTLAGTVVFYSSSADATVAVSNSSSNPIPIVGTAGTSGDALRISNHLLDIITIAGVVTTAGSTTVNSSLLAPLYVANPPLFPLTGAMSCTGTTAIVGTPLETTVTNTANVRLSGAPSVAGNTNVVTLVGTPTAAPAVNAVAVVTAPPTVITGSTNVTVTGINEQVRPFWTTQIKPQGPSIVSVGAEEAWAAGNNKRTHAARGNPGDEKTDKPEETEEEMMRRLAEAIPLGDAMEEYVQKWNVRRAQAEGDIASALLSNQPEQYKAVFSWVTAGSWPCSNRFDLLASSYPETDDNRILHKAAELMSDTSAHLDDVGAAVAEARKFSRKGQYGGTTIAPATTARQQRMSELHEKKERREQGKMPKKEKPRGMDSAVGDLTSLMVADLAPKSVDEVKRGQALAVKRINAKCRSDAELVDWYFATPKDQKRSAHFVYDVLKDRFGPEFICAGWATRFLLFEVTGATRDVQLYSLLADNNNRLLLGKVGFEAWFAALSQPWAQMDKVFAAELAAAHRKVHSEHGNIQFSGDMKDVKENAASDTFYKSTATKAPDPEVLALEVASIPSSANPRDLDTTSQQPVVADVITRANVRLLAQAHRPLEGCLAPRAVNNGVGAWVASTNRLRSLIFGLMTHEGRMLGTTAFMEKLTAQMVNYLTVAARADSVTVQGFSLFDVSLVARLKTFVGISMESMLIKTVALRQVFAWTQDPGVLPLANTVENLDPRSTFRAGGAIVVGANEAGQPFGESCGGINAVLPWRGGYDGTVRFHQCLASVPATGMSNTIFIPPSFITSGADARVMLVLYVMMFIDWPAVMWMIRMPLTDAPGGGAGVGNDTWCVPFACLMYLAGIQDINVVIPRRSATRNPGDADEAAANTLFQPQAGNFATQNLAANQVLEINAPGDVDHPFSLAEWVLSHKNMITVGHITVFLQRLNDIMNIDVELRHAYEVVAAAAVRYGPLVSSAAATAVVWPVNSATGWTQFSPLGVRVPIVAENWPQLHIAKPDMLVTESDVLAWNKLVLYTAVIEEKKLAAPGGPLPKLVSTRDLYWSMLMARTMACTTTVHRGLLGVPTALWDAVYAVGDLATVRDVVLSHYTNGANNALKPTPAFMARKLEALHCGLHDTRLSPDINGNSVYAYICPPREATCSIFNFADAAALTNTTMALVTDVWLHQTVRHIPRAFSSFPPQGSTDSMTGLGAGMKVAILAGGFYSSFYRPNTPQTAIAENETRDDTDEEIFTERVFCVVGSTAWRYLSGDAVLATPAEGFIVKSSDVVRSRPIETPAVGLAVSSTTWHARVDSVGRMIFPTVAMAQYNPISKVLAGENKGAAETWMLAGLKPMSGLRSAGLTDSVRSKWVSMILNDPAIPADSTSAGLKVEPPDKVSKKDPALATHLASLEAKAAGAT